MAGEFSSRIAILLVPVAEGKRLAGWPAYDADGNRTLGQFPQPL